MIQITLHGKRGQGNAHVVIVRDTSVIVDRYMNVGTLKSVRDAFNEAIAHAEPIDEDFVVRRTV